MLGPGWHPESQTLVHGQAVEPLIPPVGDPRQPVLERLAHHLRTLLGDFCFKSPADLVNTIGALLTGLLMSRFVDPGKPILKLDGNQPELGKTWLARVIGILFVGVDPQLIHYLSNDDEFAKYICATLRGSPRSIVLIDNANANAKVKAGCSVHSPVIEANSMAPEISLRILGLSQNYVRPNDLLWILTMNDTKTSPDLETAGFPEFLENLEEAAAEFNSVLDEVAALAEAAARHGGSAVVRLDQDGTRAQTNDNTASEQQPGLLPSEWAEIFRNSKIWDDASRDTRVSVRGLPGSGTSSRRTWSARFRLQLRVVSIEPSYVRSPQDSARSGTTFRSAQKASRQRCRATSSRPWKSIVILLSASADDWTGCCPVGARRGEGDGSLPQGCPELIMSAGLGGG